MPSTATLPPRRAPDRKHRAFSESRPYSFDDITANRDHWAFVVADTKRGAAGPVKLVLSDGSTLNLEVE